MALLSDLYKKYGKPVASLVNKGENYFGVGRPGMGQFGSDIQAMKPVAKRFIPVVGPINSIRSIPQDIRNNQSAPRQLVTGALQTGQNFANLRNRLANNTAYNVVNPVSLIQRFTPNIQKQNTLKLNNYLQANAPKTRQAQIMNTIGQNLPYAAIPGLEIPSSIATARPLARLAGSSAIRGLEMGGYSGAQAYGEGKSAKESLKSAGQGFLTGAVANTILSPRLVKSAYKNEKNFQDILSKMNADIKPDMVESKTIFTGGKGRLEPQPKQTQTVRMPNAEFEFRSKYGREPKPNEIKFNPKVHEGYTDVKLDPVTNKALSWESNNPKFATYMQNQKFSPVGGTIREVKPSESPLSNEAKGIIKTINEGGVIKEVKAKPVKIADGVETFIHPGDNPQRTVKGFVITEKSTGRAIGVGETEKEAIANAKNGINKIGEDKFRTLIKENQLSQPLPTTPQSDVIKQATEARAARLRNEGFVAPVDNSLSQPLSTTPKTETPILPPKNITQGIVEPSVGKQRGFVTSVKNSNEVSPEVKKMVQGTYTAGTNAEKLSKSEVKNLDQSTISTLSALGRKKVNLNPQEVSDAIATAKSHDALGTDAGHEMANQIYSQLAEKGTGHAQSLQAFSLLSNRTPEGMKYSAVKTLEGAGVKVEGDVSKNIENLMSSVKKTSAGSDERNIATQKLIKYVNNKIPRSKLDALTGIWRAGLLTGPETIAKVGVSHLITSPIEMASRPVSTGVDKLTSLFTGKRGISYNPIEDTSNFLSGQLRGLKSIPTKLKSGIDLPNTGGFEQTMGKGTKETAYERNVMNAHGALPKINYSGAYDMNLAEQARTEAMNKGLKGNELKQFVSYTIKNPSQKMKDATALEAEKFTNMNRTISGKAISDVQKIPVIGKFLAPFSRIPGSIAEKGIVDYTPLGLGKATLNAVQGIRAGSFDQRLFSETVGKALTGTTAATAIGFGLMNANRMTLKSPSDPKEAQLWATEGKQPNSIYVGGTVKNNHYSGGRWISLNAFGPAGIAVGLGGGYKQALQQGKGHGGAVVQATADAGRLVADQPYLKGISGFANALNDPTRYAQSFYDNTIGSVVPALSSQIATGTDKLRRDYPVNIADTLKSKIPVLRQQLTPMRDMFGSTLPGANPKGTVAGGIIGTVNPFYPSQARNQNDPATQELQRLYTNAGSDVSGVPVPSKLTKKQTLIPGTKKVTLNQQQLDTLEKSGQQVQQQMNQLINTPNYKNADDETKQKALSQVIDNVRSTAKINLATGNTGNNGLIDISKLNNNAQITVVKSQMKKPGDYKIVGDTIVYYDPKTNAPATENYNDFQDKVYNSQYALDKQTYIANEDWKSYNTLQQKRFQYYQDKLSTLNPIIDQAEILDTRNKMADLVKEVSKYRGYGNAFKKPKAAKKAKKANVSLGKIKKPAVFKVSKLKIAKVKPIKRKVKNAFA